MRLFVAGATGAVGKPLLPLLVARGYDVPAPVAVWLPELANAIGARPPWRVPAWLGRLALGDVGVSVMTRIRGASNARARRELGWQLRFPSGQISAIKGSTPADVVEASSANRWRVRQPE